MHLQNTEQITHDRVNLTRLVKRLETAVNSEEWNHEVETSGRAGWLKTQGTLQKLRYARKLLQTVEAHYDPEAASTSNHKYKDMEHLLDRLEARVTDINQRVSPKHSKPSPILPSIPRPVLTEKPNVAVTPGASSSHQPDSILLPVESVGLPSAEEFLLPPSSPPVVEVHEDQKFSETLLPVSPPKATSSSTAISVSQTPAYLQNSTALHEELSDQLAQMAAQLKRNAEHFASSLEKDKGVLEGFQGSLEQNHDVMTKERTRLRDHSSKSWGTTWITLLSIVVAIVGFMLTFFVIRFT